MEYLTNGGKISWSMFWKLHYKKNNPSLIYAPLLQCTHHREVKGGDHIHLPRFALDMDIGHSCLCSYKDPNWSVTWISGTAPVQNGLPPFRFDFRDFRAGLGLWNFFMLQSVFCDQSHLPCRGLQQLQPGMRWCVQHSQLIILTVNPCHVLTNVHNITCNLKTRTSSLFTLEY